MSKFYEYRCPKCGNLVNSTVVKFMGYVCCDNIKMEQIEVDEVEITQREDWKNQSQNQEIPKGSFLCLACSKIKKNENMKKGYICKDCWREDLE